MPEVLALLALAVFYGWRYSKYSIDPDWAYFNLYAFTGALYGRDFADCKTPGVHVFFWLLSKVVGVNVARVKFASHFLVSLSAIPVYLLTGNLWGAVAFVVLVNSGWLFAFHGNVGNVPAALLVLALLTPVWVSIPLWLLAVFYEPKLVLSFAVATVVNGWWLLIALVPLGIIGWAVFHRERWFKWVWESSVTIPARMAKWRKTAVQELKITEMPWMTANTAMYILPWLALGVLGKPNFLYWLPVVVYIAVICMGMTVRQNHLIPVVPWIALAVSPVFAIVMCAIDILSAGFYFGNIWRRFYPALNDMNNEAEKTGAWLKDKPGTLYVNGIHSGIYIFARKGPKLGMTEQVEIRDVCHERRKEFFRRWKESPPDWVVVGDLGGVNFKPLGYVQRAQIGANLVFQKNG